MRTHGWKATAVVGVMAATLLLHPDRPVDEGLVWLVVTAFAGGAVVVGIRWHRPPRATPWWLLAGCFGVFVVASLASLPLLWGEPSGPQRLASEVLNLMGYLALGAVALLLVRHQEPAGDRAAAMDAVIAMVALTTVLWSIVFGGRSDATSVPLLSHTVFAVGLLVPAGVAATCIRLLYTSGARSPAARLLASGGIGLFLAILAWTLDDFTAIVVPDGVATVGWIVAILAAGAAGLHPAMPALTQPAARAEAAVASGRLTVLGLALVASPVALIQAAATLEVELLLPVVGAGFLAILVFLRLSMLVRDREVARREIAVRASHQAALSELASDALSQREIAWLYPRAEAVLNRVLDGVKVHVRAGPGADAGGKGSAPGWRFPVLGLDGPVAAIEVDTDEEPDGETLEFLEAVANVLASAVQRGQIEAELEHRATHDALTGLPNRAQLFDRLERLLLRRGEERVGVLFIDLDGFKLVNDAHGHEVGDRLLVRLAERMSAELRAGDTVARLAGDEFVVVIDPCSDTDLRSVASRLLDRIAEPVEVADRRVQVTASVGALLTEPDDRHPEVVLQRADAAMYRAKQRDDRRIELVASG